MECVLFNYSLPFIHGEKQKQIGKKVNIIEWRY